MHRASDFQKISYKPGEAAKILGVTVKTIQNYDRDGRLPAHRTATNRRVILREDLLAFLDAQGLLVQDEAGRRDVVYARIEDGTIDDARLNAQAVAAMESVKEIAHPLVLKDVGSGKDDARPSYRRLLQMVSGREVRHVYIVSESVLSESGFHTLQTMFLGYGTDIVIPGRD